MIFDFKNLSAYGQALKSASTDVGELSKLTSNLTLAQTMNALSTKGLTKDKLVEILTNKGLTQAEAEATAAKIASTSANGVATFSLKAYTVALWENVKAIGAWMLTNPVGWIIGLGIAIGGTALVIDGLSESIEEQKDKLNDIKEEYISSKDELIALDSQIKDNIKTIEELQEKADNGTIILIEEDQLKKLRIQNDLLNEQLTAKKNLAKQDKKELSEENKETFNNEFNGSVEESAAYNFDIGNFYSPGISDYKQAPDKNLVLLAQENEKRLKDAILSGDKESIELLEEDKKLLAEELSNRSDSMLLILLEYQDTLSELMNDDGTFDNQEDQDMWNDIESWKKAIYKYTNRSGEWNTAQIKLALDTESLQDLDGELKERLDAGDLTEEDILGFTDLNTALSGTNLILEDGQTYASVYLQYLRNIAKSQDNVNNTKPDFSFGDANNDIIDNYQSQLSTLSETLNKLQSGSLSNTDLLDLLQTFPELTNKTGNLSSAIQDLITNKLAVLKSTLAEQGASTDVLNLFQDITDEIRNFSLDDIISQITDSRTLLKETQNELKETKTITVETLQSIASAYPELNGLINDYMLGKVNEKAIIIALQKEYEKDLENYKTYILNKKSADTSFYKEIVDGLSDDIINKAKQYGVDLENYKSYNEAKLAIDKQYRLKKQELESERDEFVNLYDNFKPGTSETIFGLKNQDKNFTDDFEEVENYKSFLEEFDAAIKLQIPDFDIDFQSDLDNEGSDTINEIDWAANSIENLTNKINKLNQSIENAPNYTEQLELTGKLLNKQKDLRDLLKKVRDESSDRYTDSLGAFSDSELAKYQPLIEGTEPVTLEMFEGEDQQELFEKVKAAQEAWQAYQQAILDYREQVGVVADTQQQQYELEQEERQTVIDIETNKKNDIQNKIDRQEAKYGYADEQLYQDLYDQNDIVLARNKEKLEKAKENRKNIAEKDGINSEAYLEADNEVQELQNNVSSLKQEQLELNRTILKYPIHKLEEAKELLEDQLEDVQKHKEKVTDAISAASELVQEQIDYYQDLKEATSDSYDSQIENIQKQKDALTETNDELQQQIALEKARYNLDRAMTQKTVKILRNGEFVYEADIDAIQEAQETLDQEEYNMAVSAFDTQIKNLEDEKQEALDGIDEQIEALTTYKENIDNIVSGYEQVLRLQTLISVFGKDAPQRILNGDTSIVQEMGNEYVNVASTEKTLQEQIDLYADEIEAIETYASTWTTSKDTIAEAKKIIEDIVKDTEIEFKAIADRNEKTKSVASEWLTTKQGIETELGLIESGQIIAKDNEAVILQQRLDALKYFATEATGYLNQVATALASAEQLQTEFNNKQKFLNTDAGAIIALNPDEAPEFHTGMENGFVGEKNTQDSFKNISLTKLKPDEIPAILKVGEGVLTKLQQTNILDNMRTAFYSGTKLSNFNNIQKANNTTFTPSITLNGDIILQGVQDTENFAKKIKSEFLAKLSQELYK